MLDSVLAEHGLRIMGGFHIAADDPHLAGHATLVMIGPQDAVFWPVFTASEEYTDGLPDPIDRWSRRVIEGISEDFGGKAFFPFGGPPHHPFYSWALRTGRAFESPIRFLVHAEVGLWTSFRGAIAFDEWRVVPATLASPCETCADRPCLSACPVGAFDPDGYDVDACKTHLSGPDTAQCRASGCAARRACPLSDQAQRLPEQSALHMRAFLE